MNDNAGKFTFDPAMVQIITERVHKIIDEYIPGTDFRMVLLIAVHDGSDENDDIEMAVASNAPDELANVLMERALEARRGTRDDLHEIRLLIGLVCAMIGKTPEQMIADIKAKRGNGDAGNA